MIFVWRRRRRRRRRRRKGAIKPMRRRDAAALKERKRQGGAVGPAVSGITGHWSEHQEEEMLWMIDKILFLFQRHFFQFFL
jgi:hypothetical protein